MFAAILNILLRKSFYANILAHLKDERRGDGKKVEHILAPLVLRKNNDDAFLARQLAKRTNLNPTILIIVDREDLETQTGKQFMAATDFLGDQSIRAIASRDDLKKELSVKDKAVEFLLQQFRSFVRKQVFCLNAQILFV